MDSGLVSIMQLTSLPIVIGAAIFLTWVAKRSLAGVPIASRVPVWIYTALIAAVLTYIANRITGTLEGNTGTLVIDAIINGALASGLREWFTAGGKPLAESGTAVKALEGTGDGFVRPKGNMDGWLLPIVLAGSLVAAPACGLSLTKPPVVTPQHQEQLLAGATTGLAGLEIAGIVMRDGQALVSDLHAAGTPGVTLAVRTAVNTAVIRANVVIQDVITRIDRVVKKVDQLATLDTMKEWMREGINAFLDVARELEKQTDARVTMVGRFIRTALTTVAAFAGVGVSQ